MCTSIPIDALQSGIDRLSSTLELLTNLGCLHSGVKHVLKLLFFRKRPTAPYRFWSRHFSFTFGTRRPKAGP
jgi:hypothetical protein